MTTPTPHEQKVENQKIVDAIIKPEFLSGGIAVGIRAAIDAKDLLIANQRQLKEVYCKERDDLQAKLAVLEQEVLDRERVEQSLTKLSIEDGEKIKALEEEIDLLREALDDIEKRITKDLSEMTDGVNDRLYLNNCVRSCRVYANTALSTSPTSIKGKADAVRELVSAHEKIALHCKGMACGEISLKALANFHAIQKEPT